MTQEFLLDPDMIYLNHAAVGPWPARTRDAVIHFATQNTQFGAENYLRWMDKEIELRQQLALLVNASSIDEIAILKNTSEALSFVARGLNWNKGENIIISNQEFPSNRIVWESLLSSGVDVRQADLYTTNSPEQAIMNACDENTRLISISSVQYASGLRININSLGEYCKSNNILFCIDAIQSIGALDFDVQACQADFVMADGHKWMLGPEGTALFYCRRERIEQLNLLEYGWHMIEEPGDYNQLNWQPAASARRFECGSPNMLGIHALSASLSLLLEHGISAIEQKIISNTQFMVNYIQASDKLSLISPSQKHLMSGIVTFKRNNTDMTQLYKMLMKERVICASRGGGIRFSPHFYMQTDQLEAALKIAESL